jgi:transcriptional regulator with PAS, ATPase and Fis domain
MVKRLGRWVVEDLGSRNGIFTEGGQSPCFSLGENHSFEAGRVIFSFSTHAGGSDGEEAVESSSFDSLPQGTSSLLPELARASQRFQLFARADVPVLLMGDTGTGKELMARAVHLLSGRPGAFVPVNCGALPSSLVESLLFGHRRGAFSGALRDQEGFLEAADGGTLFLDEIGELGPPAQAALLRALETKEVFSVGSSVGRKVDFRLVAATNRPLDACDTSGGFRRDLLARLSGFVHNLRPLSQRRQDLGHLIRSLLRAQGYAGPLSLSMSVARALFHHEWPMNVRELKHDLAHALILKGDHEKIQFEHLPEAFSKAASTPNLANVPADRPAALSDEDQRLRAHLLRLLEAKGGNVAAVARELGKQNTQVHRWLKRLDIDQRAFRRIADHSE